MNTPIAAVSYSVETAAAATGYSEDQIRRAIRAGDLAVKFPVVNGRALSKGTIQASVLAAWVEAGKNDRAVAS